MCFRETTASHLPYRVLPGLGPPPAGGGSQDRDSVSVTVDSLGPAPCWAHRARSETHFFHIDMEEHIHSAK